MTSNSRLKKQARAYAAEHGLAYADARRALLAQAGDTADRIGPSQVRILTVQQAARADGPLPYPFHLDPDGFVGRQDFWRGEPLRLVGFVDTPGSFQVSVGREAFLADPEVALGKHPVMHDRDGQFSTYPGPVEEVTASVADRTPPEAVSARVRTSDGRFDVPVGVGHLLVHLHRGDVTQIRAAGWSTEVLLGWLLAAPGGQDLAALDEVFAHLDEHGVDPDDPERGGVAATVDMDPAQAEAWLAEHRPGWAR